MLGSSVVNEREWKMRLRKIKTNKNQKKNNSFRIHASRKSKLAESKLSMCFRMSYHLGLKLRTTAHQTTRTTPIYIFIIYEYWTQPFARNISLDDIDSRCIFILRHDIFIFIRRLSLVPAHFIPFFRPFLFLFELNICDPIPFLTLFICIATVMFTFLFIFARAFHFFLHSKGCHFVF